MDYEWYVALEDESCEEAGRVCHRFKRKYNGERCETR
jgi:hypothetical protein